MHLRKTRKAKAAASEFVKRVISGKDVSPERKESAANKPGKSTTSKQSSRAASSSAPASHSRSSPSRGRPSSPRSPARGGGGGSGRAAPTRSSSRSPCRAPEPKPAKGSAASSQGRSPRRGRPPKTSKSPVRGESPVPGKAATTREERKKTTTKTEEGREEAGERKKSSKDSPAAKLHASLAQNAPAKGPDLGSSQPVVGGTSAAAEETGGEEDRGGHSPSSALVDEALKPGQIITPRIVFVDSKNKSDKAVASLSTSDRPTEGTTSTTAAAAASPGGGSSPGPVKATTQIKLSPTAKLIPVSSLSSINTAGKNVFTISIQSGSPGGTQSGQNAQFIVSAQPMGTPNASPIKVTATASSSSPGQLNLDLVELAKTVLSSAPRATATATTTPTTATTTTATATTKSTEVSSTSDAAAVAATVLTTPVTPATVNCSPSSGTPPGDGGSHSRPQASPDSPPINKSPKLLLSATKRSSKDERVSEGKIKKRRRPKIPAWELPSAVYKTTFAEPQPHFLRVDEPIRYPQEVQMEQADYLRIVGIINKSEIKKTDGTEHRNHRLAGGKLRRVCKPKISPEMVYRRFSLARGCIMHDVYVDSDEDAYGDGQSPRVGDKSSILKTEQSKKRSLSPKMHDSYRQHCSNKIPVITIEKVAKEGSASDSEAAPPKALKGAGSKENEPPGGATSRGAGGAESSESSSRSSLRSKSKANTSTKKPVPQSSKSGGKSARQAAKKQADAKKTAGGGGGGKLLTKSKSFEVTSKKGSSKPTSMTKSKSFEKYSTQKPEGTSKGQAGKAGGSGGTSSGSSARAGASSRVKNEPGPEVVEEQLTGEGATRRSARNRGGKRKQWWHLLRANPDEFEEDKEWDREVALQEEKRKARLERARERAEHEEDEDDSEEENDESGEQPSKGDKKKVKVKTEVDSEGEEGVDTKSYADLYEHKLKNKKKRSKDWALAKKVLEEAQAKLKDRGASDEAQSAGKSGKSGAAKPCKKDAVKRKAGEAASEPPAKKIKSEPASAPCSDDEGGPSDKKTGKLKKKKPSTTTAAAGTGTGTSSGGGAAEGEEPAVVGAEEKPEVVTDLVILGEDGEPLGVNENAQMYEQLQTLLESNSQQSQLGSTGVLELSLPPESPQSFIEILARQQQLSRRPPSPHGALPIVRDDVLYRTKEQECLAPHMCSVCWINDHMYCRNMKRIARDLPLCGGCIHYVPCHHYRQKESPATVADRRHIHQRLQRSAAYATIDHPDGTSKTIVPLSTDPEKVFGRTASPDSSRSTRMRAEDAASAPRPSPGGSSSSSNDDLLMCDEILTESDSEPNSPEVPHPPGTELLKAELRVRAAQIKRALGFKSLPKTISPLKRRLQWTEEERAAVTTSDGEEVAAAREAQEEEEDGSDVSVAEFAREEVVNGSGGGEEAEDAAAAGSDTDLGVPLSEEYLVKFTDARHELWRTDSASVFMPNTESDASSSDGQDIFLPCGRRAGSYGDHPAGGAGVGSHGSNNGSGSINNNDDESIFGENSQDSTETSLSQLSAHPDSDDSEPETDMLVGEPPVVWREERRRASRRRKKTSGLSDVISVKSVGGGADSEKGEGTPSSGDISFEGLKNKWQKSEDGNQVLTFTTKEIRERKPELLSYIKRAGLINVIAQKLCNEKNSIQKLVKENELVLRQSQDKLEQHRCLMAAVLSEIVSVKEQLRDLQTALIDEEAVCAKLRRESKVLATQCMLSDKKVSVMKNIIKKARERDLMVEDEGMACSPLGLGVESESSQPTPVAGMGPPPVTSGDEERTTTTTTAEPMTIEVNSMEAEDAEKTHQVPGGALVEQLILTQPDEQVAPAGEHFAEGSSGESARFVGEVALADTVPHHMVGGLETAGLETVQAADKNSQIFNVPIDGGHSEGHSVVLELPKDLLQVRDSQDRCQPPPGGGQHPPSQQQLAPLEEVFGSDCVASRPPQECVIPDLIPEAKPLPLVGGGAGGSEDAAMHGQVQLIEQEVPVDAISQAVLEDLVVGAGQSVQSSVTITEPSGHVTTTAMDGTESTLLTSSLGGSTMKAPTAAELESMMLQPGDLGDVIIQAGDLAGLPLQPQASMAGANMVIQQGELASLGVDSVVGLGSLLQDQPVMDANLLVQQADRGDGLLYQQGPQHQQQSGKVLVQSANGDNLFIQAGSELLEARETTPGGSGGGDSPAVLGSEQLVTQTDELSNVLLQPSTRETTTTTLVTPASLVADVISTTTGGASRANAAAVGTEQDVANLTPPQSVVVQARGGGGGGGIGGGQDIVLPNVDFLQSVGQVQTIFIDGQPYQVILQAPEGT